MQQKELKIDPELRDLLPPLTDDEYKQLEKNIVENGFDRNFPIMEWHGFIVDGHNRYSICRKHNIDYVVGTLGYETKDEVMEWMLDIQLGRRNLSPIQRIAVAEKYRPIYERQAKENQGRRNDLNENIPQNLGECNKKKQAKDREVNSQLAKMANVNPETYRQAKRVLDSDDEELKTRVLSGKTSISAGYKEIRDKEIRVCKVCGKEKKIIDFFGNDSICKECTRKESEKNINVPKMQSKSEHTENIKDVYEDVLTAKNAKDQINQDYELSWLKETCHDFISQVNDRLFNLLCTVEKMDKKHINDANDIFKNFVSDVFDIQEKLNNIMKVEEM